MSDKPQLERDNTMVTTAKSGKEFLGNEKLGDTRLSTHMKKKKPGLRKGLTINKTIEEAKILLGHDAKLADVTSARTLRKRLNSAPVLLPKRAKKASVKKAKAKSTDDVPVNA